MITPRKPLGTSQLQTLPPNLQNRIIDILNATTHEIAVQQIDQELGLAVTRYSLMRFYKWFYQKRAFREASTIIETIRSVLQSDPEFNLNATQISHMAEVIFEALALKHLDFERFCSLRKLRLREQSLLLNLQRRSGFPPAEPPPPAPKPVNPARDWTDDERKAVLRKVDEIFGFKNPPQ